MYIVLLFLLIVLIVLFYGYIFLGAVKSEDNSI